MRLTWTKPAAEAAGWRELPLRFRSSLPRENLIEFLDDRQRAYSEIVLSELSELLEADSYFVLGQGDWHGGKCVVALHSNLNDQLVVKPRCNKSSVLIKSIIDELQTYSSCALAVPCIDKWNGFWVQEFISSDDHPAIESKQLGELVALGIWAGLTDLHDENIICSNGVINLIDLECAFLCEQEKPSLVEQLLVLGLFNGKMPGLDQYEFRGLDRGLIESSLTKTFKWLLTKQSSELYEAIDSIGFRRVFIPTRIYMTFLRKRFLFGWSDSQTEKEWRYLRTANPAEEKVISSEIDDLLSWDVPIFYQNGGKIFNSNGMCVDFCPPVSNGIKSLHGSIKHSDEFSAITDHIYKYATSRKM